MNGQCLCKNGYRRDNNQNCVLICQENEVLRNNVCDCDDDFQRDASNKCVPKPKCGEN